MFMQLDIYIRKYSESNNDITFDILALLANYSSNDNILLANSYYMCPEEGEISTRQFITRIRQARTEKGISVRGRPRYTETDRLRIRATATSYISSETEINPTPEIGTRLLERFQILAQRVHIEVPPHKRAEILHTLLTELWVNQSCLNLSAEALIPVTAYCGAIGPKLIDNFPEFKQIPSVYKRAVQMKPADPLGFLRDCRQNAETLATEEEFAPLRKAPGVFREAMLRNPADPRGWLREKLKGDGYTPAIARRRSRVEPPER